jgi:hypothetical protein
MINDKKVLNSINISEIEQAKSMFSFFKKHPDPSPEIIKMFIEKIGITETQFYVLCAKLLSSFASHGKYNSSKKKIKDFDYNQLMKGIKVEYEHTNCQIMARRIAMDHLSELPDYYDRLEKMEKQGKEYYKAMGEMV